MKSVQSTDSFSTPEVTGADPKYTTVTKEIIEIVGVPKNYGLSEEEQRELDRRKQEERMLKLSAEAAERKRRNEATLAVMATQYAAWVSCGEEKKTKYEKEVRKLKIRDVYIEIFIPLYTYIYIYIYTPLTDTYKLLTRL